MSKIVSFAKVNCNTSFTLFESGNFIDNQW